jgi:non-specific protein-tyrosine kinase
MIVGYDAKYDLRTPIPFVEPLSGPGRWRHQLVSNMSRNWQRSKHIDHVARVPSLMIMAKNHQVLPPSSAESMEKSLLTWKNIL